MKIKKNKIRLLGMLLALLIPLGSIQASAATNEKIQPKEKLQFTEETQSKNESVHSFLEEGVISIVDGNYAINTNSGKISASTENELKENIAFFNEGIELGLFELDNKNYVISSNNYEDMNTYQVTPRATIINIESTLIANSDTMYRVWYMNWQTYGTNAGMIQTGLYFASKVKSGGSWDYKLAYGPTTNYLVQLDGSQEYMKGEDIGNLHYGYVGRTVFSGSLLLSAAGAYQIYSGTAQPNWYRTYYDDPNDQYWINRGISYQETGAF